MPQVLPAVAAWITTEIAIATGVTSLTALTVIGLTVTVAVDVAATVAVSAATSALSRPPEPQAGKVTAHQERPQRRFGVGTVRVSGPFMLRETKDNHLVLVIALPEGPVDHYGQFWLNDDKVTLVGDVVQPGDDNRYPDGRVTIETRLGEDTETAYTTPATYVPTLWDADHRGDGIPSLMLHGVNGDLQDMSWAFPNGEPTPSVEAFYRAYDWRDPAQDIDDDTTWLFSANPIVWAVNVLWRRFGANWDVRFAPVLDDLTVEADYCDDAVDLKAGGTEARYRCGFFFEATNAASDVMAILLASMDGWWATRFDGAYMIKAGRFDDPFDGGVVFGDVEVLDYSFDPGPTPDQARNVLVVSYTDPANDYSKVETTPWRDEADILQRGEERSEDFYPWAVQANGQVRRLAKRKALRNGAARVQVRTPLSARRGLSRRYVGLRVSECADLDGVTMEVSEATIDLASASIVWTGLLLDASIDVWDADTEEGDGPVPVDRPTPSPTVSSPSILSAEPGAAGEAVVALRFPTSGLWTAVTLYRDTDSGFAGAVVVEADMVGGLGEVRIITDTGLAADDYWYFARATDGLGNFSTVAVSDPVTVV
jgi:hypothetical protein